MKAVILVGGLGRRLRPLTFSIPKPLLPIGERPMLQIVIEQLRGFGVGEIILATGYHAELIHAFCGDGRKFGVEISYVHEPEPLGTAGPLSLLRDRLTDGEHFILMNGDVLTRLDFSEMVAFAREGGFDLTTAYTTFRYESPFGVLSIEDGRVHGIVEKPTTEHLISAGIYVLTPHAVELVPENSFFTMPDLMSAVLAEGREVGAFPIDEFWIGLETIARFDEAIQLLDSVSGELGYAPK